MSIELGDYVKSVTNEANAKYAFEPFVGKVMMIHRNVIYVSVIKGKTTDYLSKAHWPVLESMIEKINHDELLQLTQTMTEVLVCTR